MTKEVKTGAAPVSKYAAKKIARAKAAAEEAAKTNVAEEIAADLAADVNKIVDDGPDDDAVNTATNKPLTKPTNKKERANALPSIVNKFPEHVVQIALLIKNNAEIRRFTALGVLNYLLQKGEIKGTARYVSFKWNKFAVKCNGLMREYSYNEPFFLNALVASFASFSASAQRTIDNFCKKEMSVGINKAVDSEEVENIVALNEEYQGNGTESNDSDVDDTADA